MASVRNADHRKALEHLRRMIRAAAPEATECISYGMPAFRLDGNVIAGFSSFASHCSYFPFSGATLGTLKKDLADYEKTKSALHFTPSDPLPAALVRKLIKARIAEVRDA
jgi:uncharacterized protein YdhG (YjbR/CyaY superfamily)